MPLKDFAINPLLGTVMGTAHPVSPADEPHGGPSHRGDGDVHDRRMEPQEIGGRRKSQMSEITRKNGESPRVGTEGLSPPMRHLILPTGGVPICGSTSEHRTTFPALMTCPQCRQHLLAQWEQ